MLDKLQVAILIYLDNVGGSLEDEGDFYRQIELGRGVTRKEISRAFLNLTWEGYILIDGQMKMRLTVKGQERLEDVRDTGLDIETIGFN